MIKRLTAAGAVIGVLGVTVGGFAQAPLAHSCSVSDKQFISVAQVNVAALGAWSEDYVKGEAESSEVIAEARAAAKRVAGTAPTDPSLSTTRALMKAMFTEYGRAIAADAHHHNAGRYMYRAYGLANFARDVLVQAEPALRARGCDVGPLL